MRKAIAVLEQVGHIHQIHDGRWLCKCVLAAKPQQEHVRDINDFVWRFCVNYQPLNLVTRIIAYPIPSCDSALFVEFGNGQFFWLFDTPSGYHQLAIKLASQEKLAFQGPDAIKWTNTVMPFGPTNGPATFIRMMYDLNSQWKALVMSVGITIGDDTDTRIIVDDIVNHAPTNYISLLYMECQLRVCRAYCLSLSLKKSFIFPQRFEFFGNDVSPDGNRPAQMKHQLLESWPHPEIIRDIDKFINFAQFYCIYIHHFELHIAPLREITIKSEYSNPVALLWTDAAQRSMDDVKDDILSDPCLMRFNHNCLVVLWSDFLSPGFGFGVCQPGTDDSSKAAMVAYQSGSDYAFMTNEAKGVLRPVAFVGHCNRENEVRLHSHLGEGFAGD